MNNKMRPTSTAAPPTLAIVTAMICGLVKVDLETVLVSDAASAEVAVLVLVVLTGVPVEVMSVVGVGVVVLLREILDELEIEVSAGAISTMLGIEVCTTTEAVIVLCVLGIAFSLPLHIAKAFAATASFLTSVFYFNSRLGILTLGINSLTKPHISLYYYTL
jgi:hypothetical protein